MTTISSTISHGITLTAAGIYQSPFTLTAAGSIVASPPAAAIYATGGTIVNDGTLSGGNGIDIVGGAGTVTNRGTIHATQPMSGTGIALGAGGTASNAGTIFAYGHGVALNGGATLINSGTIIAPVGDAILAAGGGNSVILQPGYMLAGRITASGSGNALLLEGSAGNPLTVNYDTLGAQGFDIAGFTPGAGNYATLAFNNAVNLPGTIRNFSGVHETIDLTGLDDSGNNATASYDSVTHRLTVTGSAGSVTLQLAGQVPGGLGFLAGNDGSGGTAVHLAPLTAPALSGVRDFQGAPNGAPLTPFAGLVITDPFGGANESITLSFSCPHGGTLSIPGMSSIAAPIGDFIITLTGTTAAMSAAVAGVSFTPALPTGVLLDTTEFGLAVSGPGGTTTASTSVTVARQLFGFADAAQGSIRVTAAPQPAGLAPTVGGAINEAVIVSPVTGGTYAVPAGTVAAYLGGTADATLYDPGALDTLLVGNSGNDQLLAGTGSDTIVTGAGQNRVLLNSGNAVVQSNGTDQIQGGSGAATIMSGANNLLIFLGSGASSVNTGVGGHATVVGGSGDDTIVSHGGSMLWLGSFRDTVTVGSGDVVAARNGSATVNAPSGNAMVFGGSGTLTFFGGSGTSTISTGTGLANVTAGAGGVLVAANGAASINATSGAATVIGLGAAGISVTGGNGVYIGALSGHNHITTGPGAALLVGRGDGDVLTAGGADTVVAGAGAETIDASAATGATYIAAGVGDALIMAGDVPTHVLAGSGAATIIAGHGDGAFAFTHGNHASAVITGFNPALDVIGLMGFPAGEAATALAGAVTSGGSESLVLSDGTHIMLAGYTGLTAANFV